MDSHPTSPSHATPASPEESIRARLENTAISSSKKPATDPSWDESPMTPGIVDTHGIVASVHRMQVLTDEIKEKLQDVVDSIHGFDDADHYTALASCAKQMESAANRLGDAAFRLKLKGEELASEDTAALPHSPGNYNSSASHDKTDLKGWERTAEVNAQLRKEQGPDAFQWGAEGTSDQKYINGVKNDSYISAEDAHRIMGMTKAERIEFCKTFNGSD